MPQVIADSLVLWIDPNSGKVIARPETIQGLKSGRENLIQGNWAEIRRPAVGWPWVDFGGQVWIWHPDAEAFQKWPAS